MRALRDWTIKQKILMVTMVTIAASLLLAGTGIVISDSVLFRSAMRRDLAALANIVGDNSTAALQFEDRKVALDVLTALKARPYMAAACIYKPDGTLFARYSRPGAKANCISPALGDEVRFADGDALVSHPVLLDGKRVGTLVMTYDLDEAVERTKIYIGMVLAFLLASSLVAFLISARLREIITGPISSLARAAAAVSQTGNYSVRVRKYSEDEVGIFVDAFNDMLSRVQSRDFEIQNARNSLQTTLTSIGDAVISTDAKGLITFANPAACSLLRQAETDLIRKPVDHAIQIIDESSRKKLETPVSTVLSKGTAQASTVHTLLIAADGTEFPIESSASPIRDVEGKTTGVVLIVRDIGNRRATEKLLAAQSAELRQNAHSLKEANERKDEFLAMLAHELRNPLAPIRNAVEVVKTIGVKDERQNWALQIIERQTRHMVRLIDDLLDVSRIMRGKVTLQPEVLELSTVIQNAVEASRPLIDARKQQLTVSVPKEPIRLKGDLTRLVQVIGNLLNNAAKFTGEGGVIHLHAQHKDKKVIVRVMDNGIGLTPELGPRVFDLFVQADRSLDRTQGGLGIGLTVVRSLVELHGGEVEAISEGPGRGSEFIVRLPALDVAPAIDARRPQVGQLEVPAERLRILVLEDNVDSAEMLRFMLELGGHEVKTAYDGAQALEAAEAFRPQVVLCDIGLPTMNGYQVAVKLRATPDFKQTRLIALSGYGREEDRLRSKEAGFDYHLTKPVEPDTLAAVLSSMNPLRGSGNGQPFGVA